LRRLETRGHEKLKLSEPVDSMIFSSANWPRQTSAGFHGLPEKKKVASCCRIAGKGRAAVTYDDQPVMSSVHHRKN